MSDTGVLGGRSRKDSCGQSNSDSGSWRVAKGKEELEKGKAEDLEECVGHKAP